MENTQYFDFYGVKLLVRCSDEGMSENIRRDFSYFKEETQSSAHVKIDIYLAKPLFEKIHSLRPSFRRHDSVVYDDKEIRYVDHQGKVLTIYNYKNEEGEIYSEDEKLLHELSYLLIQSRVGELLDKKGIHRIHALGISIKDKGILCLLPQGAGKTTLALELLKNKEIKLLSDDTTLINRNGSLLGFSLRIGIPKDTLLDIPKEFLRSFKRRKYGEKTLIDIEYFKDSIASFAEPAIILLGKRTDSDEAKIVRTGKLRTLGFLIRDAVIGIGVAQMVEYFLRLNIKDIFGKIYIVYSRLRACFKVLLCSKTYCFYIGKDKARNTETLNKFLENRSESA